jgi:hypothetical protein
MGIKMGVMCTIGVGGSRSSAADGFRGIGAGKGGVLVSVGVIVGVIVVIGRRIECVQFISVTAGECQTSSSVGSPSEHVDAVLDLGWHG